MDGTVTHTPQEAPNTNSTATRWVGDQLGLTEALTLLEMLEPYRDQLVELRGQPFATQVTELLMAITIRDIDSLHEFINVLSNNTETVLNGFEAASKFTELWLAQDGQALVEAGLLSGAL